MMDSGVLVNSRKNPENGTAKTPRGRREGKSQEIRFRTVSEPFLPRCDLGVLAVPFFNFARIHPTTLESIMSQISNLKSQISNLKSQICNL
jgi:hypothetical protein